MATHDIADAEQIGKLPRWAQAHIREITRQRDEAIDEYNKLTDNQTPSVFYANDLFVRVHPPEKWNKRKSIKVYFGGGKDGGKKAVIRLLASNVIEIVPDPYNH